MGSSKDLTQLSFFSKKSVPEKLQPSWNKRRKFDRLAASVLAESTHAHTLCLLNPLTNSGSAFFIVHLPLTAINIFFTIYDR